MIKKKQGILQQNIPQKYYSNMKFCIKKDTITTKCKCVYYISLMTILSCKSILISCWCILKLNFILFFEGSTLIGLSQKIHDIFILPNINNFYQSGTTIWLLFQGISWMHILLWFVDWIEILFINLFITIFGLSFYKSLGIYCDSY